MSTATGHPVVFDPASGRLRLDADTFIALGDLDGTAAPKGAAYDALRRAGAIVDDQPHVSLRPGLAAVTRPIARLELVSADADTVLLHQGWLSLMSAVLADRGDGSYDFASVATEFLPTVIARLTGFGPRPRLPEAVLTVDERTLEALFEQDAATRTAAVGRLAAAAPAGWEAWTAELEQGAWRLWSADVTWPAPGTRNQVAGRRVAVLDTEAGLLTVEGDESGGLSLVPLTPTDVWLMLSSILPADSELTSG